MVYLIVLKMFAKKCIRFITRAEPLYNSLNPLLWDVFAVLATVRYPHWKSLCHSPMEISGNPHWKFLSNESAQGDHRGIICTCSVSPEWNLLLYSLLLDSSFLNSFIWCGHPVLNNIDFQEFTLLGVWKFRWNTVSCVWCNISNARNSLKQFPNTKNRVENTMRSGVFWTKFKLFR